MSALELFHAATREWFSAVFSAPTEAQEKAWPLLHRGDSTLLLAPTGSGKTLAAFLHSIDALMFSPRPAEAQTRVLYISPLKSLGVDIERNLRAPLIGVAQAAARMGLNVAAPSVGVRSGDTTTKERARLVKHAPDILITTPESLYLMLTSRARESLRDVRTVIIDEIHAMVPTERGSHLMLSLERLEALCGRPLQRIGLSATCRPLDEVARFLGGAQPRGDAPVAVYRPVSVVDAQAKKQLTLHVEVPVEDLSIRRAAKNKGESVSGADGSIWAAIHPQVLELIDSHRSTLIFVNSRRLAERLAQALNDLKGETLVHAHHGSVAKDQRARIEEDLKAGRVKALVATSSLELGIDMGAIDLVVLVEAPPSVASGLQRIGRAGHQVGGTSEGIVIPKYRGDLVACAALVDSMRDGIVESTRYQRNPLDVLAQHIVAIVAMDVQTADGLFARVRQAAPFADLTRSTFERVLDMLSGKYASDDFADLKPRITWDRLGGSIKPREGAQRVAILNGGTIPDRGLYGVFLVGAPKGQGRVGELDEEMVFESRPGETFVLGASTWRIEEITFDKVLVSPAPGQPGKMPFWRGEAATRPLEFGQRIGALVRKVLALPHSSAVDLLNARHGLNLTAAESLLRYLGDQQAAGPVPDDRTLVIETSRDELGDLRICVLSPLGGQVLAPWSMAVAAKAKEELGVDVETMWTNDGFVVRLPEGTPMPGDGWLVPRADEVEGLVMRQLSTTPLFAARFREAAARALLLPRRRPAQRTPLWQQRKRSSDLMAAAARFDAFPITLEAYRKCLADIFDMSALTQTLRDIERQTIKVVSRTVEVPSPFAANVLFGYVANFIYDGDAPLQERRAQALSIDTSQLRELLGELELRDVLDADVVSEVEAQLQALAPGYGAKHADGLHDLLLKLGDLRTSELVSRAPALDVPAALSSLAAERRAIELKFHDGPRWVAVEHASRFRDAFGVPLPPGLPEALLSTGSSGLEDVLMRYARTHGPFTPAALSARYGLRITEVEQHLKSLSVARRLVEGAFSPFGKQHEWCAPEVLQSLRLRSLAKVRKAVEPVRSWVFGRFLVSWHGVLRKRRGLDALLDAIEKLQGLPVLASQLERELLPARVEHYLPSDLDALAAAGEVVWVGVEASGEKDGRIALYLTESVGQLHRPAALEGVTLAPKEQAIVEQLSKQGALFFSSLHQSVGGGFAPELVQALWSLTWKGLLTNDSFFPLRELVRQQAQPKRRAGLEMRAFRSRRAVPVQADGRWSLVQRRAGLEPVTDTQWATRLAHQWLSRYGLVTREIAAVENTPGGFSGLYDVFKALEDGGKVRRGYFVEGVGAMQFAQPMVLDVLRSLKEPPEQPEIVTLGATDPANPYGALLKWPQGPKPYGAGKGPMRQAGANVVVIDGHARAWLGRGGKTAWLWVPEDDAERGRVATMAARAVMTLHERALLGGEGAMLIEINGQPAAQHELASYFRASGYSDAAGTGLHLRKQAKRLRPTFTQAPVGDEDDADEEEG
ncbi:MAG: DEAD/DEAH box helicase [Myxococcales bacterium]|nr:DEAD/DEAH box helicase [Myxococcales bacterium]